MGDETQPAPATLQPRIGLAGAQAAQPASTVQETAKKVQETTKVKDAVKMLSGQQLKTMAVGGGFAVDDATGDQMIQALEGIIDSLTSRWHALEKLQDTPPLSSTATAQWVSGHMVNTATDAQGLLTQLQQAKNEFPTYVEAIKLAKRNYQDQDESVRAKMTKVKPLS